MTSSTLTIIVKGKQYMISNDHINFKKLCNLINAEDINEDTILSLISIKEALNQYKLGNISIKEDCVYYKDHILHNSLVNRIVELYNCGLDITNIVKFLDNLMENPNESAINEFYDFLEFGKLPITQDGHFLAYKKVSHDFKDIFTRTFNNSIGTKPEMPRDLVDDDREQTCSTGLHFCSKDYLSHYGSSSNGTDKIIIIKINPKDVVSIPKDYNNTKGRCCKYEVLEEYNDIHKKTIFDKPLVNDKVDLKLSKAKAKIYNVLNKLFIQNGYTGLEDPNLNLDQLRFDDEYMYKLTIDTIMHSQDKLITRGTAVDHFKFFKDNY